MTEEDEEGCAQPGTSASTPTSPSGTANGVKTAKDRKCPFCNQAFTSSSLGRHLDLYIKPKNPKPADGVHDVEEIRKLRGGITRRQPRASVKGAGGSVNNDQYDIGESNSATPSVAARMPARNDQGRAVAMAGESPVISPRSPRTGHTPRPITSFNSANWQATGVINGLPPREPSRIAMRPDDSTSAGQTHRVHEMRQDAGGNRIQRPEYQSEGMAKLEEHAEMGRAAEMALREVLGSLEAAQKAAAPQRLYEDFEFFTLNFPGLTLAILPAPSTLFSPTPFASADSWTLRPPSRRQFDTMGRYLNERVAQRRKTEHIPDSVAFRHHAHLAGAWEHWQDLSEQDRGSAWNLEILRCVSRGQDQQRQLRAQLELSEQRVRHLETEFDRLSRCQLPREYLMHPPNTIPIPGNVMREVRPSQFKTEVATMGYDAEAILVKWRSTIRALTRRPNLATQSSLHTPPQPQVKTSTLSEDMMLNGSVWGIGGPMPRDREHQVSSDETSPALICYHTPPEPGVVVGAEDDESNCADTDAHAGAFGEAEDASSAIGQRFGRHETALVRRRIGEGQHNSPLNVNGKRALNSDAASGRNGGTKLYKEHIVDGDERGD